MAHDPKSCPISPQNTTYITVFIARWFFLIFCGKSPHRSEPREQPPILVWSRSVQGGAGQPLGQRLAYALLSYQEQQQGATRMRTRGTATTSCRLQIDAIATTDVPYKSTNTKFLTFPDLYFSPLKSGKDLEYFWRVLPRSPLRFF